MRSTVPDDTFKEAARAMGLLEDDTEHRRCLQEASVMNMPSQMRQLFATLMVFQTPSDIRALFEEFKEAMCEDCIRHDQLHDPQTTLQERHIHLCLWDIDTCLRVHDKYISDIDFFDLPQLPGNFIQPQDQSENINNVHEREQGELIQQLNHIIHLKSCNFPSLLYLTLPFEKQVLLILRKAHL